MIFQFIIAILLTKYVLQIICFLIRDFNVKKQNLEVFASYIKANNEKNYGNVKNGLAHFENPLSDSILTIYFSGTQRTVPCQGLPVYRRNTNLTAVTWIVQLFKFRLGNTMIK